MTKLSFKTRLIILAISAIIFLPVAAILSLVWPTDYSFFAAYLWLNAGGAVYQVIAAIFSHFRFKKLQIK
jgi:hypothetical protein